MRAPVVPGRTIAIGDIHGCSAALATILETVKPTADDLVVTLGDYIDRGPDSRGVVDRLIRLQSECRLVALIGNHEDMLAEALRDKAAIEKWLRCGGTDTLRSYGWRPGGLPQPLRDWFPERHRHFLSACRPYFETPTHIFVHAGLLPDLAVDRQPPAALFWRVSDANSLPHLSGKVVVVGHTPQKAGNVLDLGHLIGIDTDCVRGGWLTAVDLTDGTIWQADRAGRLR